MTDRKILFQKLKDQIISAEEKVELYKSYLDLVKFFAKQHPLHIYDDLVGDGNFKLVEIIEIPGIIDWAKVNNDDPTAFISQTLKFFLMDCAKKYLRHSENELIEEVVEINQVQLDIDERIQQIINQDKNKKRRLYKEAIIKLKKMNYSCAEIAKIVEISTAHVYRLIDQIREGFYK